MASANRTNNTLVKRIVDGFIQYDYTETWQVVDATGIVASLSTSGLPTIGSEYYVEGVKVWCYEQTPTRRDAKHAKNVYDVLCRFSNSTPKYERDVNGNPAQDPEDIVPKVDVAYEEYQVPSTDANLIGFTDSSDDNPFSGFVFSVPPYLALRLNQNPAPGNFIGGPLVNSANDVYPNRFVERANRVITYWRYFRNWESQWDEYIGHVNADTVTISQYDQDGLRLRYTFQPFFLRLKTIIKEDVWRDGKLYFRRGLVLAENKKSWLTKLPDEGFNKAVWTGQYKGSSTWTTAQLDAKFGTIASGTREYYHKWPIVVTDEVTLATVSPADPVPLNSYGLKLGEPRPQANSIALAQDDTSKSVWYLEHRLANLGSDLGIS